MAPLRPLLFYLSRVMGCSITMLEQHYAHLLGDSEDYRRGLLDSFDEVAARSSGVIWRRANPLTMPVSK